MFLLVKLLLSLFLFLISVIKRLGAELLQCPNLSYLLTKSSQSSVGRKATMIPPDISLFCAKCSDSPKVSFTQLSSAMTVRRQVYFWSTWFPESSYVNIIIPFQIGSTRCFSTYVPQILRLYRCGVNFLLLLCFVLCFGNFFFFFVPLIISRSIFQNFPTGLSC